MAEYIQKLVDWRDYGFDQVFVANGGSMARDILQEFVPELLITDIKMPRISGLDLSAFIDEKKYPTKVIIISGYSDFGYARQALHYGVSEYLVKPVLKGDLVETLERILQKNFVSVSYTHLSGFLHRIEEDLSSPVQGRTRHCCSFYYGGELE